MNSYVFTFGLDHKNSGSIVLIHASSCEKARELMMEKYGLNWSWQYELEDWNKMVHKKQSSILDVLVEKQFAEKPLTVEEL